MNKAEAKKRIQEMVEYLIHDPATQDIIDNYTETFMDILQLYADEQSREEAVKFIKDTDEKTALLILCDRCKPAFEMLDDEQYESMFDEWKYNQEGER